MIRLVTCTAILSALAFAAPATAETSDGFRTGGTHSGAELPAYLQCVPYAREQSGIQIYGDAHEWWSKAEGRFDRGNRPKVGAVMAFQPHRNMQLGHVAAVSKIIDRRTVLLRHANWSPINGRRGQIENDVRAIDVSRNNDWSEVRVWYDPIQALGKTAWPVHGFIYSDKAPDFGRVAKPPVRVARAKPAASARVSARRDTPSPRSVSRQTPQPSGQFLSAFANLDAAAAPVRPALQTRAKNRAGRQSARTSAVTPAAPIRQNDDFESIIAKYDN
ncbi:CHAP domain-containing protein [Pontixanthobacter sp.]|uniref:CHAP domain-containing protein n=1 Tax=Pontixanthobacter sp. TaxID=2792078 RepID=UPI003C7D2C91